MVSSSMNQGWFPTQMSWIRATASSQMLQEFATGNREWKELPPIPGCFALGPTIIRRKRQYTTFGKWEILVHNTLKAPSCFCISQPHFFVITERTQQSLAHYNWEEVSLLLTLPGAFAVISHLCCNRLRALAPRMNKINYHRCARTRN